MSDIIVTTPKSRMAEAAREAEEVKVAGGGWYYRDYRGQRVPDVDIGDRVYYVEDGYIRGFAVVAGLERIRDRRTAEVLYTRVMMDATMWTWIKPIPMTGFQGFRYARSKSIDIRREEVEVVGYWLDPRPEAR